MPKDMGFTTDFDKLIKDNEDIKILQNIFQYDKEKTRFVKFSFMFNLFNVALLSEKYFEVYQLFFKDNVPKEDLENIFNDYQLDNLFNLLNFIDKYTDLKIYEKINEKNPHVYCKYMEIEELKKDIIKLKKEKDEINKKINNFWDFKK